MPSYLIESYLTDSSAAVADARERAQLAAELGSGVRYVRTTFLPDDETVLHVFEAASAEALERAARLAALEYERIVEAVERSADATAARLVDKGNGGCKSDGGWRSRSLSVAVD